ncbi:ribonuclease P protein component [Clostridium grantii]|nr:ribonuclease P protein component [Clostridium grantii]
MKKEEKIRKNKQFTIVYRRGKSIADSLLVLYVYKNNQNNDINKVGISVSKKVGNSVVRSRVKRLISEGYRLNRDDLKKGYDFVFIARNNAKGKDFKEIEKSVIKLMKRAGLYN